MGTTLTNHFDRGNHSTFLWHHIRNQNDFLFVCLLNYASFLLKSPQITDDTDVLRWLRPLWECIGNNFIAKIQVPSFPKQHHPRTDTHSLHTPTNNKPSSIVNSSLSVHFCLCHSQTHTFILLITFIHSFSLLLLPSLLISFCIPLVET